MDGHCLNSYYYFQKEIEKELPREKNESLIHYIKRYKKEVDNNSVLKKIRQNSKPITFGISYGAFPKKIAQSAKLPIETATEIFNNYHNNLYADINKMRTQVLDIAKSNKKIHLGLGCIMNVDNPDIYIRTIFNACSQFWSIITLLTINKLHSLIDEKHYENDIQVISTIYDSIYILIKENPLLIQWVNNIIIELLTRDYLKDIIVHNEAEGAIGYNWYDLVTIPNNASLLKIRQAIKIAKDLFLKNK